jgi:CRISPR-associated protein Csc3
MADEILLIFANKQKPLIDDYLESVVQGGLRKYQTTTQRGIREGQDLYSHLTRGAMFLYSLGSLLDLDEQETRLLMAAFSIHDLNKLYEPGDKGLRQLADNRAFLEQMIKVSGVADFLPAWEEYFIDLKQLILGHGGHSTLAGEQLLARITASRVGKERLQELTHLMRAVDVADLSRTFEESTFKAKFLLEINSVGVKQFRWISHRLGEHRGILSNIIHNKVTELLEEYGATPIMHYPEGTWYLVEAKTALPERDVFYDTVYRKVRQALGAMRSQDLSKIVVLTKDGVKVDTSLFSLGLGAEEIIGEITRQVFRRRFTPRDIEGNREKCEGRFRRKETIDLTSYLLTHQLHYPESEDSMRTGELLRALYNLLNMHLSAEATKLTSGLTDPWDMLYHLLDVDGNTLEPFDKLYDRPFVLAGTLGQPYPNVEQKVQDVLTLLLEARAETYEATSEDFLPSYLTDILAIDFAPPLHATFATYLHAYTSQNHHQCCYSASAGQTGSWMSPEVPKGIVVQQFSNRLEGGVKREPKRNICPVCREQFFLEQMLFRSGGSKGMYLHFFPDGGLPAVYLETVKQRLDELARQADPDTFFLPTETSLVEAGWDDTTLQLLAQRARGFAVPRRSEAIGNIISLSICPGFDISGDGARVLQSVEIGLRLAKFLGLRCLISESPIPPLIPEQCLYIDTLPVALQGFFGNQVLDWQGTEELLQRYAALRLVDREVRTGFDSVAWELVRALGASPLEIFAVADRALERKLRQGTANRGQALGMLIRARICSALKRLAEGGTQMADMQSLSARVRKMAEIATEYKLWGRSRVNRNSLLDPLSTAFENLRRKSPEMDMSFVRAQTIEEIFAHLSRVRLQANPRFRIGKTKRQGITTYVDEFYRMVEEIYRDQLPRVLPQEKAIKAAYLCFLSEAMTVRNIEPLDEEPEEGETEGEDHEERM